MLSWLTKRLRTRAALVLAVLYASCVITPPIALAFTDGASAAHCLADDHHGTGAQHMHGQTHVHDDGNVPGKGNHGDKGMANNCCGLFCVTAGAIPSLPVITEPGHTMAMNAGLDGVLRSRASDRIDRPPRSLLSL
jgi:hypothetical protein